MRLVKGEIDFKGGEVMKGDDKGMLNTLELQKQKLESVKDIYNKKVRLWKTLLVLTILSNICLMILFIKNLS